MSLADLISLLNNRLSHAANQRASAFQRGDVVAVAALDADMASTQATLDQLQSLL